MVKERLIIPYVGDRLPKPPFTRALEELENRTDIYIYIYIERERERDRERDRERERERHAHTEAHTPAYIQRNTQIRSSCKRNYISSCTL